MAEYMELSTGSLFMDQLFRDIPDVKEWIERFELNGRFFLYKEYNEPRYIFETHDENGVFTVYLKKLTDDVEFWGDFLKQIKRSAKDHHTQAKIIMEEKYDFLEYRLKWNKFKEETFTDKFDRTIYIFKK